MKPAILTAAIVSLAGLIWRSATSDECCPYCGFEVEED